jgi:hypothetical protein
MKPAIEISKFETSFGNSNNCKSLKDQHVCKINCEFQEVSVLNEAAWSIMVTNAPIFDAAFKKPIK